MIDIYQIDEFGQWTGVASQIEEADGCDAAWVRAPTPPEVAEGGAVVWAIECWHARDFRLTAEVQDVEAPPSPPPLAPTPVA